MKLGDIINISVPLGTDRWTEPNFENYRTVVFDSDFMARTIGIGEPRFSPDGEILGFDSSYWPGTIELRVWLSFVPDVYRDNVMRGAEHVFATEFHNEKA